LFSSLAIEYTDMQAQPPPSPPPSRPLVDFRDMGDTKLVAMEDSRFSDNSSTRAIWITWDKFGCAARTRDDQNHELPVLGSLGSAGHCEQLIQRYSFAVPATSVGLRRALSRWQARVRRGPGRPARRHPAPAPAGHRRRRLGASVRCPLDVCVGACGVGRGGLEPVAGGARWACGAAGPG